MPAALAHDSPIASLLAGLTLALVATGCPGAPLEPTHPPAEAYGEPADFSGEWIGEIGDVEGTMRVDALAPGSYYGYFKGEDRPVRYIVSMKQLPDASNASGEATANLCTFTWQDGRGGQGSGWVLINREDSALTGTFGRGRESTGMGVWTFIRFE